MGVTVFTEEGCKVATDVEIAKTMWTRFRGLMFRREFGTNSALMIPDCKAIHCCFMRMPIDVVFVSADHEIVYLRSSMKPWTFSPYVKAAAHVIECPAGTIESCGLTVGQRLNLRELA